MAGPTKVGDEEGGALAPDSTAARSGDPVEKSDPQSSEAGSGAGVAGTQPARGDAAPTTMRIVPGGASPVPPEERQADIPIAGIGEKVGDQTIPAIFDKSGGSLPVEATPGTRAHEEAVKAGTRPAVEELNLYRYGTNSRQKLTQEKLEKMSKPEIRAVANDRGYDIGEGGRAGLIRRFLEKQGEDKSTDLHEEGQTPKEFEEQERVRK